MIRLLALSLIPAVVCLRCYDYTEATGTQNVLHRWVECPFGAQYCFKSYVEQELNGVKTYLEQRSCGTPQICRKKGCDGNSKDRQCCCESDLCNGSSTALGASVLLMLLVTALFI